MRKPEEISFSELPDIFHDVYGHVPMLMNNMFCDFMTKYSSIAIDYSDDDNIVACFGRLYWFTMEMGLVREGGELKPFGGAILTSSGEIENIRNPLVAKHHFDLEQVINTEYDNLQLQKEYFYIDSFYELFQSLTDMSFHIDKMLAAKL
jgi:phenylalanine-4-hydroxylase